MAFDAYMAFSGSYGTPIKGESTRKGYEGWIEIDYFDFDVQQKLTIGSQTSGAGAGIALANVHWTGDTENGDTPSEVLAFQYGALHVTYTPQKIDGTAGAAVVGGWNQIKNEKT